VRQGFYERFQSSLYINSLNSPNSFPGSAWERNAWEALPPVKSIRLAISLRYSRGGASRAVRSQAEPGNELLFLQHFVELLAQIGHLTRDRRAVGANHFAFAIE